MRTRARGGLWPPLAGVLLCAFLPGDASARPSLESCAAFTSHDEIGAALAALAEERPEVARAFTVGLSASGLELFGLVASVDPEVDSAEPAVRIIGAIHGDECMAAELVLQVARWLVRSYGEDPFVTDLLGSTEVVLVPLVNPDGYSSPRASRTNGHGVDLNRNFGFAWVGDDRSAGREPFSEPESRAIRDLGDGRAFVLGLTYHTRAEYVNGPWNYTPNHPPDGALIDALGEAYAGSSGYDAVFGWDWYAIFGDVNDWSLGTSGTLDWTIELRSDGDMEWALHEEGLRSWLGSLATRAEGVVRDALTGEPLAARVTLEPGRAPVFTDPDGGDFSRLLLPGAAELAIEAPGYVRADLSVAVVSGAATRADVAMVRARADAPDHGFAVEGMTLPEAIDERYRWTGYRNRTLAWSALGPPDGVSYSMSPGGTLTLDLGRPVLDGSGPDLVAVSGTGSADSVALQASVDRDGPYVELATGSGDVEGDLASAGLASARFVRLVDEGVGPFNDAQAGYDVDAVVSLWPEPLEPLPETDGDADVDADGDADADADGDVGSPGDADAARPDGGSEIERRGAACGCRAPGGGVAETAVVRALLPRP